MLRDASTETKAATHRLQILMNHTMRNARGRADAVAFKLSPAQLQTRLSSARMRFDAAIAGCHTAVATQLEDARGRFVLAAASLDALSPLAVLQRGYAIAQDKDGKLLRDAQAVSIGDSMHVRLAKGRIDARVERTE
jgi:exodeoxyribonuclease VII large subunit